MNGRIESRVCEPLHNISWGRADPIYNQTIELDSIELEANYWMTLLAREIQNLKEENQFLDRGHNDDDENRWDIYSILFKRYKVLEDERVKIFEERVRHFFSSIYVA